MYSFRDTTLLFMCSYVRTLLMLYVSSIVSSVAVKCRSVGKRHPVRMQNDEYKREWQHNIQREIEMKKTTNKHTYIICCVCARCAFWCWLDVITAHWLIWIPSILFRNGNWTTLCIDRSHQHPVQHPAAAAGTEMLCWCMYGNKKR